MTDTMKFAQEMSSREILDARVVKRSIVKSVARQ